MTGTGAASSSTHLPAPVGVILAAGAGRRYGMPKALAVDAAGVSWMQRVSDALVRGGCGDVVVVLGAEATRAESMLPHFARAVRCERWQEGLSQSVRTALGAAAMTNATSLVLATVDIPEVPSSAIRRLVDLRTAQRERRLLLQATYLGAPGHPVLIGRDHWQQMDRSLSGDRGARPYLRSHGAREIECGDLWDGADIDEQPPAASPRLLRHIGGT